MKADLAPPRTELKPRQKNVFFMNRLILGDMLSGFLLKKSRKVNYNFATLWHKLLQLDISHAEHYFRGLNIIRDSILE